MSNRIELRPKKPFRMFIGIKNDQVIGRSYLSLSSDIACLFNVTTSKKEERNQCEGTVLSLAPMILAKN